MTTPKATLGWERVGDRFYRKIQLYTSVFDVDFELGHYSVVGAPYSGAVAVYRNTDAVSSYRASQATNSTIDIYNYAGGLITQIAWDKGTIRGAGWSEDERLLVITQDGTVYIYAELQDDFTSFSLGHGAEEWGVQSCCFWNTGFVALLANNSLVAVTRYDEPRPQLLAPTPSGDVTSFAVIPPEYTASGSVEVLLSLNKSIFVVDAAECEDRGLDSGPFHHIAISPNGKFVALYTADRKVWVISSDFQDRFTEYDSRVVTPPRSLQWCGNNAVVLAWEDEIHLVGPNGAATKYFYDSFAHICPDIDGVRILTNDVCEFLQKVPDASQEVFRLGSTSPSAVLLDAADQLEKRSPKADDNIQLIKDNLDEAVDVCTRAAGEEFRTHWQKQLLKAASFGKSVLDLYNSDDFVDMTETLRVRNAVRAFEVGIPLSQEQYLRLTPERLIQRLINRQHYLLALKVCQYLHLPDDRVYVHWARRKVRASKAEESDICREIVQKLQGKRGISFDEIARTAFDEGRSNLAAELIEHETRSGKQAMLLLEIGKQAPALDKALLSGDSDLILRVLLELKRKLPLADFFRAISNRAVATAIVESSAIDQDEELLKDLFYQDDRRVDGANLLLSEGLAAQDAQKALEKLKMAGRLLKDSKELAHQSAAVDDAQRLLRQQLVLKEELDEDFTGLSINETIVRLIQIGQTKRAQRIQSDFKINDKVFWWIRLRALVSRRDWSALEVLSKERKSPIGWEPFFNEILGAGNPKVASVFISKCINLATAERADMWLKCGMVSKAGEEAFKAKDRSLLEQLRSKADGSAALDIDRLLAQMQRNR